MTLLVVSLFLPNTINFKLPTYAPGQPETKKPNTSRPSATRKASLFPPPKELTPPVSPISEVGHEQFFTRGDMPELRAYQSKHNASHSVIAPSDPHSPAWGTGQLLTQPFKRTNSPPSANILKHTKTAERALALGRAGIRQPQLLGRSESHDRVFAIADWTVVPADQGNGGLRNAVQAAVRTGHLDDKIWVGTLGMPVDVLEATQQKQDIEDTLATEHDTLIVWCKDADFVGHYTNFCKTILWPVFNYQIPDNPKSKAFEDHSWVYYVKVNQDFADKIIENWKRDDVLWVHDYHLLLVPGMVRKKIPDAKIGFFLHVAFPSSEVFRCLAVRKELLEGVLGANLIGFQIQEYARHFLSTCIKLLNVEANTSGVQLEDRFVDVFHLAIGIDPVALDITRLDPEITTWINTMQEKYRGKKLIVARDKLDHVRGVRQKLLAFELFLNKHPEWRDNVVMIQVATSTTDQVELDATVSDIVTRVNSSFANLAYQPLVYLKQDISYSQYLALLTVADALMITSQREGMNLTCHEYLFCQDGKGDVLKKHGSLILSEFTGSSSVFRGAELSVNPWDYQQCANAIETALTMGDDEKRERWTKLYAAVNHHTADHWLTTFLQRLDTVYDEHHKRDTTSVPRLTIAALEQQYRKSEKKLFILDYEGTLATWGSPNSSILTSPQRTLDVLNDLLQNDGNIVYIMSSRTPEELDQIFKRVPNLGFIAENGCFIKEFASSSWQELADPEQMQAWKDSVGGIMTYYQERTPGSWIESRHCSIIFHYEDADDMETASRQAGDCSSHINDACESQGVKAIPNEGSVAVEPIEWSKATAAKKIFEQLKASTESSEVLSQVDFLMVVGDGRDDEVIYRWANELGGAKAIENVTTVSLGRRNTEAGFTLTQGVIGVLSVLQRLAAL